MELYFYIPSAISLSLISVFIESRGSFCKKAEKEGNLFAVEFERFFSIFV